MKLMASFILKILMAAAQYKHIWCINLNSAPAIKLRTQNGKDEQHKSTTFPDYKTFSGGKAELPCNITRPSQDDNVTLVLWYRDDTNGIPIYSVDTRSANGSLDKDKAKHFVGEVFAGNRANFDVSVQPALLRIDPVLDDDGMEYRCRVDFKWGRTMISYVTLNVIVPPRQILIKNENNLPQNGLIGPYNEGSQVKLICESKGGNPPPVLRWYKNNQSIDESYSLTSNNLTVYNDLVLNRLTRSDLNSILTCEANNNITKPIKSSVSIDINLKPIDVEIVTPKHTLYAGREVEIVCESRGSRPPAQITWYKDQRKMTHSRETFSHDGNMTTSVIRMTPNHNDNGAYLGCRSQNLKILNSSIEDGWKLNVIFKPNVTLIHKQAVNSSVILNDGDEFIVECVIKSNPNAKVIKFFHNNHELISDEGLQINNSTLIIASINPKHKGIYFCIAINSEGRGTSNEIHLKINYAPICAQSSYYSSSSSTQKQILIAKLGEPIQIVCNVDAHPADVDFYWNFNKTSLLNNSFTTNGLTSELTYYPKSKSDFGLVTCWSKNLIGTMKEPCSYKIAPSGPPSSISECRFMNQSATSIIIDCISDDVLSDDNSDSNNDDQFYHLELYDSKKEMLILNTTNQVPIFNLHHPFSSSKYIANVYVSNSVGKSKNLEMGFSTLTSINKKLTLETPEQNMIDAITGIVAGFILIASLLSIIMIIICKLKKREQIKVRKKYQKENDLFESSTSQTGSVFILPKGETSYRFDRTNNPDLIPHNNQFGQTNGLIANDIGNSHSIFMTRQSSFSNIDQLESQHLNIWNNLGNIETQRNYAMTTAV